MQATGNAGELRFRYQVAARLGEWKVKPVIGTAGRRFRISATIVARIDPWAQRRPLDLYLSFGKSTWIWNSVEVASIAERLEVEVPHQPTILQRSD